MTDQDYILRRIFALLNTAEDADNVFCVSKTWRRNSAWVDAWHGLGASLECGNVRFATELIDYAGEYVAYDDALFLTFCQQGFVRGVRYALASSSFAPETPTIPLPSKRHDAEILQMVLRDARFDPRVSQARIMRDVARSGSAAACQCLLADGRASPLSYELGTAVDALTMAFSHNNVDTLRVLLGDERCKASVAARHWLFGFLIRPYWISVISLAVVDAVLSDGNARFDAQANVTLAQFGRFDILLRCMQDPRVDNWHIQSTMNACAKFAHLGGDVALTTLLERDQCAAFVKQHPVTNQLLTAALGAWCSTHDERHYSTVIYAALQLANCDISDALQILSSFPDHSHFSARFRRRLLNHLLNDERLSQDERIACHSMLLELSESNRLRQ